MKTYRVHIGYTRKGRDRWKRFANLESAVAFTQSVFERTGIILTIV